MHTIVELNDHDGDVWVLFEDYGQLLLSHTMDGADPRGHVTIPMPPRVLMQLAHSFRSSRCTISDKRQNVILFPQRQAQ